MAGILAASVRCPIALDARLRTARPPAHQADRRVRGRTLPFVSEERRRKVLVRGPHEIVRDRPRKMADGTPVSEVQIHFATEPMAQRCKRPLLDVGARVFYEGLRGHPVEITE